MLNPTGLCLCGCGEPAPLAKRTNAHLDMVRGEPLRYVKGHAARFHAHDAACLVDCCDTTPEARGLCHSHLEWSRRHDGATPTHLILRTDLERFEAKVKKLPSGHWMWTGARASRDKAYGAATLDKRVQPAHRVAWQLYRGPIPEGLVIDHLCRVTLCVNPDHLQPATGQLNTLRGDAPSAVNAAKTHCVNDHPFEGDNLIIRASGSRDCRTCRRERTRRNVAAWRARQKAAAERA